MERKVGKGMVTINENKLSTRERIVLRLCLFALVFIKPYAYSSDDDKYTALIKEIEKELN